MGLEFQEIGKPEKPKLNFNPCKKIKLTSHSSFHQPELVFDVFYHIWVAFKRNKTTLKVSHDFYDFCNM